MSQLALPFELVPALGRRNFVAGPSNSEALAAIDRWQGWPGRRLALVGPPASGKSHLAAIWTGLAGAQGLDAAALETANPTELSRAPLLIEDGDREIAGHPQREAGLFHLVNAFAASGQWLLLTGRSAPARWPVALPDLASRLSAMNLARLASPDDALLRDLLLKQFSDRGVAVPDALVPFLLRRMERSAEAAAAIVETLDAAAMVEKSAVSVSLARRVLGW